MPIQVSPERFDELVEEALDAIPDQLASRVTNLVVLVEDEPSEDQPGGTLGLYDGGALGGDPTGHLPDRIWIFRGPLLEFCDSEEQLVREIRITVVHEVGHHFGIDDRRLHELGWG